MRDLEVSNSDTDFARELESLSEAARQHIEERTMQKMVPNLMKALKPLVLGIEALSRATEANSSLLATMKNEAPAPIDVSGIVSGVQDKIDQRQQINQQLFDALHAQMKDYRDGFLLEVMQKPVVRDLIDLFDLFAVIVRQFDAALEMGRESESATEAIAPFETLFTNLSHTQGNLLEVLERMEVKMMPPLSGRLDKQKQRALSVVPAETIEEDMQIQESLKPGFQWRDRVFRPEEVVVKKWKEGYLMMMPPDGSGSKPSEP